MEQIDWLINDICKYNNGLIEIDKLSDEIQCIENYEQVKDIDRIITDNLYRLNNKKYYIEKCDKLRYKWYKK